MPKFLTPAELAERWSMSPGSLANQRSARKGPAYVKIFSTVRYPVEDVEAFEQQGRVDV